MTSSIQNCLADSPIVRLQCIGDPACIFLPERNGLCAFHWRDSRKFAAHSSVWQPERKSVIFADYVLLHGSVFPVREKAPFSKSGQSLSGALEYDPAAGTIKCHECGDFFLRLYRHINVFHDMAVKDYRKKHGLAQTTKLEKPIEEPVAVLKRKFTAGDLRKALATRRKNKSQYHVVSVETMNLKSKCRAQILFRLAALGARLGRTPKITEIRAEGLSTGTLCNVFGSRRRAIELAGMIPRDRGYIHQSKSTCRSNHSRVA